MRVCVCVCADIKNIIYKVFSNLQFSSNSRTFLFQGRK